MNFSISWSIWKPPSRAIHKSEKQTHIRKTLSGWNSNKEERTPHNLEAPDTLLQERAPMAARTPIPCPPRKITENRILRPPRTRPKHQCVHTPGPLEPGRENRNPRSANQRPKPPKPKDQQNYTKMFGPFPSHPPLSLTSRGASRPTEMASRALMSLQLGGGSRRPESIQPTG